jgi:hypothetical protein
MNTLLGAYRGVDPLRAIDPLRDIKAKRTLLPSDPDHMRELIELGLVEMRDDVPACRWSRSARLKYTYSYGELAAMMFIDLRADGAQHIPAGKFQCPGLESNAAERSYSACAALCVAAVEFLVPSWNCPTIPLGAHACYMEAPFG